MKLHLEPAYQQLLSGCERASNLKAIHEYLDKTAPTALNCDDILRSSLVLAVSSFDLFIHDLFRIEVVHRLSTGRSIANFRIPSDVLHSDTTRRASIIDEFIRNDNAHKSFVAPEKLAECLKPLISSPWDMIAKQYGDSPIICKSQLRSVVNLRNRIAHEADINPAFGGIDLWPIYGDDVGISIIYLKQIGLAITNALDC